MRHTEQRGCPLSGSTGALIGGTHAMHRFRPHTTIDWIWVGVLPICEPMTGVFRVDFFRFCTNRRRR
jgi:hypothetical protein